MATNRATDRQLAAPVSTLSEKIWKTNPRSWAELLQWAAYHEARNPASDASRKKTARRGANAS